MARETYVMRGDKLVAKRTAAPKHRADAATQVISDTMAETWHPANGKHYDSKSTFRKVTRAHGCVEIGSENFAPRVMPKETPDHVIENDVRRAIYELENPWARR